MFGSDSQGMGRINEVIPRCWMHNDVCPEMRVDTQTFDVYVDGDLAYCEPLERVSLGQRYVLR